jgi:hypothetical protein
MEYIFKSCRKPLDCCKEKCTKAHFNKVSKEYFESYTIRELRRFFIKNEYGSIVECDKYDKCVILGCKKGHSLK